MTCQNCADLAERVIEAQRRTIAEQSITIRRLRERLDRMERVEPYVVGISRGMNYEV